MAHQQVDDQADQAQAQCRDQHQPLRRIRVHLVQRADLQHPRRADHAGEDPDGVAALAQRHHRIALGHTAALVVVHVRLLGGHESQIETKTFFLRQLRQPFGLFGHRITHQLVGQQVNGRASQLFADLLDFPHQHQLLGIIDQSIDFCRVRPGLLHQCLAAHYPGALAEVEVGLGESLQRQGNAQQALPHQQRPAPFGVVHRPQVVGHQ